MHILVKTIELISRLLFRLAELSLFAMVTVVFVNVIMRYIFNHPFYWGEEVTNLFLVSFTFFSAAKILLDKSHIKLTIFITKYSEKTKIKVDTFISVCGIIFAALVSKESYSAAIMAYNNNMTSPTLLSVPLVLPYSIMCLGFVFLFLVYLIHLGRTLSNRFD